MLGQYYRFQLTSVLSFLHRMTGIGLSLGAVLSRAVPDVSAAAVIPDVYDIDEDRPCNRCALSLHPAWPLAQKERIGELLGWQRAL